MVLPLLEKIRVLDTTRLLPGGFCSMVLSHLGAQVIKVEQPGLGDYIRQTPPLKERVSMVHTMVNRNKRSIGIDLKTDQGKRILRMLVRRSDVFLEGFRPGVMDRLGFSFASVKQVNPRIVYCSISAFGKRSPLSSIPGHDLNFQALAGTLGSGGDVQMPSVQYADLVAGLYASVGILAALGRRPRDAVHVDVPMVPSLISLLILPASAYFTTGKPNRPGSSFVLGSEAFYNLYKTSDARYMAVAAIESAFWSRLMERLAMDPSTPRRPKGKKERMALTRRVQRAFASKTRKEWTEILMKGETSTTPVLDIEEALDSEWGDVFRRGTPGAEYLVLPIGLESRRGKHGEAAGRPAPTLGQHTREILSELGIPRKKIDRLEQGGSISTTTTTTTTTKSSGQAIPTLF